MPKVWVEGQDPADLHSGAVRPFITLQFQDSADRHAWNPIPHWRVTLMPARIQASAHPLVCCSSAWSASYSHGERGAAEVTVVASGTGATGFCR